MTSPEPNCLWAQALYSLKLKTAVAADFGTSWIAHLSMAPHRFHLAWAPKCPPRHHTLGLLRLWTAWPIGRQRKVGDYEPTTAPGLPALPCC